MPILFWPIVLLVLWGVLAGFMALQHHFGHVNETVLPADHGGTFNGVSINPGNSNDLTPLEQAQAAQSDNQLANDPNYRR